MALRNQTVEERQAFIKKIKAQWAVKICEPGGKIIKQHLVCNQSGESLQTARAYADGLADAYRLAGLDRVVKLVWVETDRAEVVFVSSVRTPILDYITDRFWEAQESDGRPDPQAQFDPVWEKSMSERFKEYLVQHNSEQKEA